MSRVRKWGAFAVLATLVAVGMVEPAMADSIQIGTGPAAFDTGIDVQALIVAVVAVFAPLFLFILTAKYGYRIVKSLGAAGARLFKA